MFCLLVMGEGSPHVVDNWPERQVMADHETTEVSGEASLRNNFLSKNSFLSFPYQKESTIKSYFSRLGFDKYVKPLPRGRKVGRHVVLHQLCFLFGGGEAFYLALLYILQDLSFLTRNWTWGVSSESKESWPLDCHGLPGVSYVLYIYIYGTSLVAQTVKRLPTMQETRFDPWVGKIPWRRKWQPTPLFLPGKSHGLRILVGYSPWGLKELDTTEWLHFIYIFRYR